MPSEPPESPENSKTPPATKPPIAGILIFDKPTGISSMRAVAIVRHRARRVKTGHAGTLDPLATGVLVLALGKATKQISRLMATEKKYLTIIDLSAFTASDDQESLREEVAIEQPPTEETLREVLAGFVGNIMQTPPIFSAVMVDGKRAYLRAREGEQMDIQPRPVVVHAIELVSYQWPEVKLAVHCGKGFYIRQLARDLGERLGTGGYCLTIRRTAVGPFTLEMASTIDDLPEQIGQDDLLSIEAALEMMGEGV